ncbi:MAG TPA: response regulator, partial [Acidimicrobiales bacterium]|nr:response regulator [Acidimicrobiales bacterium]
MGDILVVEDNRMQQLVVLRMLDSLGYRADVARSGDDAITLAATRHYDLVLMDCDMPGMDGYETTRILRELEREVGTPGTPVIGMGSAAGRRTDAVAAGMDGAVPLPLKRDDVRVAVERWLGVAPVPPASLRPTVAEAGDELHDGAPEAPSATAPHAPAPAAHGHAPMAPPVAGPASIAPPAPGPALIAPPAPGPATSGPGALHVRG